MVKLSPIFVILVLVLSANLSEGKKKKHPTIDVVGYGTVQGVIKSTSWSERKYLKFKNIKYASCAERFKPAVSYPMLNGKNEGLSSSEEDRIKDGIINLHKASNVACPSLQSLKDYEWDEEDDSENIEDCLFLSVSTKNRTGNQPVMVYLAGYDVVRKDSDLQEAVPNYLMEKDIVLVTVQYRVGPFGFLSTLTDDMPGNVGVLDVIEALRWIQKYIKYFGGDPKRVTLFGQYHSAAIINVLTMTPIIETENLFTQVIYQSGSALLEGIASATPLDWAKKMGTCLNCESVDDITLLTKCLKTAKVQDLLTAYAEFVGENKDFSFLTIGGPSGLLPEAPHTMMQNGKCRGYPTIGGSVKHPGLCGVLQNMNSSIFRSEYKKELDTLKKLLGTIVSKNEDQIKFADEKFPNKIFFTNIFRAVLPAIIDIKGIDIKYATSEALKYNTQKGSPSYLYAFNYLGVFSRLDCSQESLNDISLADDSIYLFPYPEGVGKLGWKDTKMAKFMVDLWTSFAADGCPTALGLHKWPALEKETDGPYLGIDFIYKMGFDYSNEYFVTVKDLIKAENIYDVQ